MFDTLCMYSVLGSAACWEVARADKRRPVVNDSLGFGLQGYRAVTDGPPPHKSVCDNISRAKLSSNTC